MCAIMTFYRLIWTDFGKLKHFSFAARRYFSWSTHRKCPYQLTQLACLRYHKNEVDIALEKLKKSEKHKEDSDYETNFKTANRIKAKQVIVQDKVYDVLWTTEIRIAFIAHLVVRVLMELIFIALHYRLQMEQNGVSINETQPDVSYRENDFL